MVTSPENNEIKLFLSCHLQFRHFCGLVELYFNLCSGTIYNLAQFASYCNLHSAQFITKHYFNFGIILNLELFFYQAEFTFWHYLHLNLGKIQMLAKFSIGQN